jgi:hypothetical protein
LFGFAIATTFVAGPIRLFSASRSGTWPGFVGTSTIVPPARPTATGNIRKIPCGTTTSSPGSTNARMQRSISSEEPDPMTTCSLGKPKRDESALRRYVAEPSG